MDDLPIRGEFFQNDGTAAEYYRVGKMERNESDVRWQKTNAEIRGFEFHVGRAGTAGLFLYAFENLAPGRFKFGGCVRATHVGSGGMEDGRGVVKAGTEGGPIEIRERREKSVERNANLLVFTQRGWPRLGH